MAKHNIRPGVLVELRYTRAGYEKHYGPDHPVRVRCGGGKHIDFPAGTVGLVIEKARWQAWVLLINETYYEVETEYLNRITPVKSRKKSEKENG